MQNHLMSSLATNGFKVIKMETEEIKEKDIYTFEGVENYFEDDELSSEEEGFMCGYLAA